MQNIKDTNLHYTNSLHKGYLKEPILYCFKTAKIKCLDIVYDDSQSYELETRCRITSRRCSHVNKSFKLIFHKNIWPYGRPLLCSQLQPDIVLALKFFNQVAITEN